MTQCKYCGSETELFVNGVPVCLECTAALEKHEKKSTVKTEWPQMGQSTKAS